MPLVHYICIGGCFVLFVPQPAYTESQINPPDSQKYQHAMVIIKPKEPFMYTHTRENKTVESSCTYVLGVAHVHLYLNVCTVNGFIHINAHCYLYWLSAVIF
jgi:hypothetical protein